MESAHPHLVAAMRAPGEEPRSPIITADGVYVGLADGSQVLDATSQGMAALLGHGHPALRRAINEAASAPYVADGSASSPARHAAAERLLETAFAGEDWAGAVRFCLSGSEANDLALSLAQALTGRGRVAARAYGYHGGVGLARSTSLYPLYHGGLAGLDGGYRPVPAGPVNVIPAPEPDAVALAPEQRDAAAAALADAAALITDVGSVGFFPGPGYLDDLARLARGNGALWVQDEIVTAPGRIGRWFAFQRGKERPDIVTLGKGITAGAAPGAALVLSKRVMEMLEGWRWQTVATLWGHPLSLAAITATVETIEREGLVRRAAKLGGGLRREFAAMEHRHPCVARIVGDGLVWDVVINDDPEMQEGDSRGEGPNPSPAQRLARCILAHDVLVAAHGTRAVWVGPPLTSQQNDIELLLRAIEAGLADMENEAGETT